MRVGVTQRIMITSSGEVRDCLDHRWVDFLGSIDAVALPLPNAVADPEDYLSMASLDGLVLSGGDDLASFCNQPQPFAIRDNFELAAVEWAIRNSIPILGVCRGFQLIATKFGGELRHVPEHAGSEHRLYWDSNPVGPDQVASHHNWALTKLPSVLKAAAYAPDGTIEAAHHRQYAILGLMWHPERIKTRGFQGSSSIGSFLRGGTA